MKMTINVGDIVATTRPFKVYKDNKDGTFEICDTNGNCLRVKPEELYTPINTKQTDMKAMKNAVLKVAQDLAKANNTVTTLEVKTELRRDYPYFFWDQDTVSKYMDQLAGDGVFTYTDNGTYRIYSVVAKTTQKLYTGRTVAGFAAPVTKSLANTAASQTATGYKVSKTKIGIHKIFDLATASNFSAFVLKDGTMVTRATIKGQKKSPLGYVTPKVGKVKSVIAGNVQYDVK